ncbi:MAG: ketopantoate reductase family protein [Acidobacteria bacterium]|nr:ketopantoate reductase family protein [Acidobacteriota bacterium]
MRYVIHGAGALGSLVGGRLAASGAEVVLIGREDNMARIASQGLELWLDDSRLIIRNISACTTLEQLAPADNDRIFLAVKSSATSEAVQEIREHYGEATPVFCLQNGVRNEELVARRFLHVYGVMAGLVVRWLQPGVVAQILYNDLSLGGYPLGCDETALEVANTLRAAGFNVTTHESIMAVKWSKLLLNLNNATLAALDSYLQLAMATSELAALMAEVVEEGLKVLEVAGIPVAHQGGPYDLPAYVSGLKEIKTDQIRIAAAANLPAEKRAYPSTWVDLHNRCGGTEAAFLNGEIVLLGEKLGLPTPYNSTLLEIVERMANDRQLPGAISLERLKSLIAGRS